MFSADPPAADWRTLFAQWQEAEQRGEERYALDLLIQTIEALHDERQRQGFQLGGKEQQMLHALGVRLQLGRWHQEALAVYGAARQIALERGDAYGTAYFELLGSQSCVALLDLTSAAEVLGRVLGLAFEQLDDAAAALRAASTLDPPRTGKIDRDLLRVAAFLALGRFDAARGRLGSADVAHRCALDILERQESHTFSTEGVRLKIAELRLDRGDFAALEALLEDVSERRKPRSVRLSWRVLEAGLKHLQGRFSEADRLLASVADGPQPLSFRPVAAAARWQRIHTLAALNRLDEAEALVRLLARESASQPDVPALDLGQIRALLHARRSSAASALHLPPASHQILLLNEPGQIPPESPPEDLHGAMSGLVRTRERVRDEFGRLFNAVHLALHHGHLESAQALTKSLEAWVATLDAPLLTARQHHLRTLVAYYGENFDEAQRAAAQALEFYERLELVNDAWSVRRVLDWTLKRHRPSSEEIERNRQRLSRLQDAIASRQEPIDQALYGLNKWSTVDEAVSGICRELRRRLDSLASHSFWTPRFLWGRWRRRLVRRGLYDILEQRRLDLDPPLDGEGSGSDDEASPAATKDVYRLMRDRLHCRLGLAGPAGLGRRLVPWWLPADTAVLQYVVLPDRVELFLLTRRNGIELVSLPPVTRPHLWELTRKMLFRLRDKESWRPSYARRKNDETGQIDDLSALLGLPAVLERLPDGIRYLAVVPDDILAHVPFAALPVDGRPLIHELPVALLPAFAWSHRDSWKPTAAAAPLGVAVTSSEVAPEYEPLTGACRELEAVSAILPGDWCAIAGAEATRERVLVELSEADLVHFACHGDFRPENPEQSGLLLHDGWLTLEDLEQTRLDRLEVVMAASCWGASTTVLPGAVQIGLPFALLDRGAGIAIAVLWPANDAASVELANDLYQAVERGGPISGLAQVQKLWFERGAPTSHWAGHVAYVGGVPPRRLARWYSRLLEALGK